MPSTLLNMYVHNIDPTLFSIGFLEIRFYGIVYALGFLLVYWLIFRRRKELGIDRNQIDNLMIFLFIGLLVGARIFHFLFSEPFIFFQSPLELFKLWHGGMSFFGALVGIFIACVYYLKKLKLDWRKFADVIVIGVTIALVFGRIANFINGELVGTASNLPWCVIFSQIDYVCRHPYQIYASISHALLFGVLMLAERVKERKDGFVFFVFLVGYSLLRFITDFWRMDVSFFGLTVWQYVCLVVIVISIYIWKKYRKS